MLPPNSRSHKLSNMTGSLVSLPAETEARVSMAQELATAQRDIARISAQIQNAKELFLAPPDRRAYLQQLETELQAAVTRRDEALLAMANEKRERQDAAARVKAATDRKTRDAARHVVAAMLPLVEQVDALNRQLEGLRTSLGNPSAVPTPFRPHLLTVERWLEHARRFAATVDGER
jgi:hypothetical protein